MATKLNYKTAGVDIDAGNALVERIKPAAKATARPGATALLGGFGACFDLKAAGYSDPVLVAATDGVGTKLRIAIETGIHHTIGIDLVAMCVNDLTAQRAEPLFFLDYFATAKLDVDLAQSVIEGIAQGCKIAGCALIGGETAEMPGMYISGDYDIAGFAVGAIERHCMPDSNSVNEGDVVLGLASNGLHANGFSLARKIVEHSGLSYQDVAPFQADQTLGEALLVPTRIYGPTLCTPLQPHPFKTLAHITGGGLLENIPRALPDSLCVQLDAATWPLPPVFRWLQQHGRFGAEEMARVFNCGIGMAIICAPDKATGLCYKLQESGETVYQIGSVLPLRAQDKSVVIKNMDKAWAE